MPSLDFSSCRPSSAPWQSNNCPNSLTARFPSGKVKLNPFAFSVAIRGLLIKDKDGEPFLSWDEVYVNFQLSSFLGHPWVFKKISVTGPFARAQLNKDGTFNFSDLITKFAPTNAPAAATQGPGQTHRPVYRPVADHQRHRLGDRPDPPHAVQTAGRPVEFHDGRFRNRPRQQESRMPSPARPTPVKEFPGTDFSISTRCVRGAS